MKLSCYACGLPSSTCTDLDLSLSESDRFTFIVPQAIGKSASEQQGEDINFVALGSLSSLPFSSQPQVYSEDEHLTVCYTGRRTYHKAILNTEKVLRRTTIASLVPPLANTSRRQMLRMTKGLWLVAATVTAAPRRQGNFIEPPPAGMDEIGNVLLNQLTGDAAYQRAKVVAPGKYLLIPMLRSMLSIE